jgi:Uma2 family endonuclease
MRTEEIMTLAKTYYTREEYLELERMAEYKNEYVDGQIYAMPGANRKHNLITVNLASEINSQLRERPYEVYASRMRVTISSLSIYYYPDVVAVSEVPLFEDMQNDSLLNPTVIVEVLSPSTEAYDRGAKFAHYRRLTSLVEYVLVAQDRISVELYTRRGEASNEWVLREISSLDDSLRLTSIDCEIAMTEIYDKVVFSSEEGDEAPIT